MNEQRVVPNDEQGYRLHVVDALARLETLAESTDTHLKTLNGSVGRHETRLTNLTAELTRHPMECPLRAELERLKIIVITDKAAAGAAEKVTTIWLKRLSPLAWAAIGALALLILLHSKDFIPFLQDHLR